MTNEDIQYYRERAIVERERAAAATKEEIAEAHRKLAMMYENLLERLERAAVAQDLEPLPRTPQQPPTDTLQ